MPRTHEKQQEPRSVKLKLDTRLFEVHLCGRRKNSVTVHIIPVGQAAECEPDGRWEPGRKRP